MSILRKGHVAVLNLGSTSISTPMCPKTIQTSTGVPILQHPISYHWKLPQAPPSTFQSAISFINSPCTPPLSTCTHTQIEPDSYQGVLLPYNLTTNIGLYGYRLPSSVEVNKSKILLAGSNLRGQLKVCQ